jgi:putative ABC transport system permease protein
VTVIGVVKDFHYENFHNGIDPMAFEVFSAFDHFSFMIVQLKSASGASGASVGRMEKIWQRINPGMPFEYHFLDAQFQQHYSADARQADMVGWATGIAIFISCMGLFGLCAFSAEQRTKEIGIRKVLGASAGRIVGLLSADFLKLVLAGILLGTPVGWYFTHRWLQGFAYRTTVPWTLFLLTTIGALLIAAATISFQALKAALANPVKSLRNE